MNVAKFLVVLAVLVGIIAIVELVMAPRPSQAPNPRVNGGVYDRIMPGMSEKQIEEILGKPHDLRCGEVVKFEEPPSREVGFEIVERPVRLNVDTLNTYQGLNGERILVLLGVGNRTALAVQYSIEGVPVLYKGQGGAKDKSLSPLSLDHPMPRDVQDNVYRFVLDWSLRKNKNSDLPLGTITWERRSNSPGAIVPPPPPPPPVAEPSGGGPPTSSPTSP
jgi:hypothetical protein